MKTTIIFGICLLGYAYTNGQSQGPNNGSQFSSATISGFSQSWTSQSNVAASDNSYSSFGNLAGGAGSYTDYLVVTGFGFDLPDGCTVYGVKVDIERSDPNQLTSDYSIRLTRGGILSTGNRSTAIPYPATDAYQSYGSSTDQWGDVLSFKEIDNNDFGVAIAAQRNAAGGQTAGQIDNIQITVYYGFVTLPVTLRSFQATKQNETVKVSWITETESNISNYVVERSADGNVYKELQTVESKNQQGSTYSIIDQSPVPGSNYYRLKIWELNGTYKYSSVASVYLNGKGDMKISPSPWSAGQDLYIANPAHEDLTIRFYNARGEWIGNASTDNRLVPSSVPSKTKGLVYYQVVNASGRIMNEGNILVY